MFPQRPPESPVDDDEAADSPTLTALSPAAADAAVRMAAASNTSSTQGHTAPRAHAHSPRAPSHGGGGWSSAAPTGGSGYGAAAAFSPVYGAHTSSPTGPGGSGSASGSIASGGTACGVSHSFYTPSGVHPPSASTLMGRVGGPPQLHMAHTVGGDPRSEPRLRTSQPSLPPLNMDACGVHRRVNSVEVTPTPTPFVPSTLHATGGPGAARPNESVDDAALEAARPPNANSSQPLPDPQGEVVNLEGSNFYESADLSTSGHRGGTSIRSMSAGWGSCNGSGYWLPLPQVEKLVGVAHNVHPSQIPLTHASSTRPPNTDMAVPIFDAGRSTSSSTMLHKGRQVSVLASLRALAAGTPERGRSQSGSSANDVAGTSPPLAPSPTAQAVPVPATRSPQASARLPAMSSSPRQPSSRPSSTANVSGELDSKEGVCPHTGLPLGGSMSCSTDEPSPRPIAPSIPLSVRRAK